MNFTSGIFPVKHLCLYNKRDYFLLFTCTLNLCISVSAKGFYKSQGVVDFVRETLPTSQHQLEDPRCQIDRLKFEKAIRGNAEDLGL